MFKFELNQTVMIKASGEFGQIIGRAEYVDSKPLYHVHYKCADGRAVTQWWGESLIKGIE